MNNKFLMYILTGNILFLFMPVQQALMFSLLGGSNLFGGGTAGSGSPLLLTSQGSLSTGGLTSLLPLMLLSGGSKKRSYRRYNRNWGGNRRTIVYNNRGGYRRWR